LADLDGTAFATKESRVREVVATFSGWSARGREAARVDVVKSCERTLADGIKSEVRIRELNSLWIP
jgi:hypothetical protein